MLGSIGFGSVSGGRLGVSRRFDSGTLDLEHVIDGLAFFELGVDPKLEVPISAGSFMLHSINDKIQDSPEDGAERSAKPDRAGV